VSPKYLKFLISVEVHDGYGASALLLMEKWSDKLLYKLYSAYEADEDLKIYVIASFIETAILWKLSNI
jgi:hypothetical protein